MKRILTATCVAMLFVGSGVAAQNVNPTATGGSNATTVKTAKKRGPVFRATKEQVREAQSLLKQRSFYGGEITGKLDANTREGLKKYQQAEGIKATGTLNRATLEKMNITLTDKQRMM